MLIIYLLAPMAILLAFAFLAAFVWAARRGQMDDLDTPPLRMLLSDTSTEVKNEEKNNVSP